MKQPIIFLDGKLLKADQKQMDRLAPWHLSGRGVFETMLVEKGVVLFLAEHLQRLDQGLKTLRIKIPLSRHVLLFQIYLLIGLGRFQRARLRLTIWRDKQKMHIAMIAVPLNKSGEKVFHVTLFAKNSKAIRTQQRIKSIDYKFFANAYALAQRRGYDEAIIFNERNEIMEASRSNIFIVKDRYLLTPSLSSGGLKGITRQVVLKLAREKKIKVKETRLYRDDLEMAQEVFLTNSINGIAPVVKIDNQKIGRGRPGLGTKRLQSAYQQFIRQCVR